MEEAKEPAEEAIEVKAEAPVLPELTPPRPSDYAISQALYPLATSTSHEVEGLRGILEGLSRSRAEPEVLEGWEAGLATAQAHLVSANRSLLAALAALAPEND